MAKKFENKTVVITGASSGFGEAFAEGFAKEGARLVNIARRKDRLDALEKRLREMYQVDVLSIQLDISDQDLVQEKLKDIPKEYSSPDFLINNAGMVRELNKTWETPWEDIDVMIDTNIKGLLYMTSHFVPAMLARNSGHIINIGSISSHDTYPGGSIYCATKYAVKAITDTLRKELVATPLRVSMISPGLAETEFSLVRFAGDKAKASSVYSGIQPLTAFDVAEIVLFIASRPPHVDIADIIIFPTNQASVSIVHRSNN